VNRSACEAELNENWAVLSEAIQTIMRKHNIPEAYEKIKALTRGNVLTQQSYLELVDKISAEIGPDDARVLREMSPAKYIGLAPVIAQRACSL
jgi:adenylosuccinate lyase